MAEVKSYKCDICEEVYHTEENSKNFIKIIDSKQEEEDEVSVIHYDHICPGCEKTIKQCIENPGVLDEYKKSNAEKQRYIEGYKALILKVWDRIHRCHYGLWTTFDNPTHYENAIDDSMQKYDDLRDTCNKQKTIIKNIVAVFGGLVVGNIIALILKHI